MGLHRDQRSEENMMHMFLVGGCVNWIMERMCGSKMFFENSATLLCVCASLEYQKVMPLIESLPLLQRMGIIRCWSVHDSINHSKMLSMEIYSIGEIYDFCLCKGGSIWATIKSARFTNDVMFCIFLSNAQFNWAPVCCDLLEYSG